MPSCVDCGGAIAKPARGPFAKRCAPCNTEFRIHRPDKVAKRKGRTCKDCGVAVPAYKHFCVLHAAQRQIAHAAAYQRKQQLITAQWLRDLKEKTGCALCGENFAPALDYHHRLKRDKKYAIGKMYNKPIKSLEREIELCILLCANCHRKVHGPLSA